MGLSHIYRNVKQAMPGISLEDARAFAVYLRDEAAKPFLTTDVVFDIEPNRQLAAYAEGFRNINRTFGKFGSRGFDFDEPGLSDKVDLWRAVIDLEDYSKGALRVGRDVHQKLTEMGLPEILMQPTRVRLDNVRLSSPDLIRKLHLNSEFPRIVPSKLLRWPCGAERGDSLRSTPIKLDSAFLSSDDLEDLRTYDPRQAYIDRMMDKRHRDWQEQNGLAPSPRERFNKLLTSLTTSEALDTLSEQKRHEILGTPYGAHTLEAHTDCKIHGCAICEGGLAYCKVCGGAEASLPTECPGEKMSAQTADDVVACRMDFKGGKWIKTQDDPK
jgi:hypothetical protein